MDYKEILGIIAVVLAFGTYIPIYFGIFFGKVRPHIFTYLVWTITVGFAFVSSFLSGGGAGSWVLGVTVFLVGGIFLLCFKYGTKDITRFDTVALFFAIAALVPWFITKDPTISIILITIIEITSFFPTFRKTWNDPYSEIAFPWVINSAKHALTVLAVSSVSVATVFYPAVLISINLLLAGEIMYRKIVFKKLNKS